MIDEKGFVLSEDFTIANDFDLIALEAAVRLKEEGVLERVVVFSASPGTAHLLKALAMGADEALWAEVELSALSPEIVAKTAICAERQHVGDLCDCVWFLGKIGVNFESHQTGQILSHLLHVPCVSSALKIDVEASGAWRIACESEFGVPTFCVTPPFVVTADLRLAEPRFPSLPNIVRARKKRVISVECEREGAAKPENGALREVVRIPKHCAWIDTQTLFERITASGEKP